MTTMKNFDPHRYTQTGVCTCARGRAHVRTAIQIDHNQNAKRLSSASRGGQLSAYKGSSVRLTAALSLETTEATVH